MKFGQNLGLALIRAKFSLLTAISKKNAAKQAFLLFKTPQRRAIKKESATFTNAERVNFNLHGDCIRGYQWNKGAPRKALIIHGFESTVINFEQYISPLVGKGYEVLAFDAPAHGRSEGRFITAPLFAEMITTINNMFGPIKSYMAHSFGCMGLALALEQTAPPANTRVVFIAPVTETTTAICQFFRLLRLNPGIRPHFNKLIEGIGNHPAEWYSLRRMAPLFNFEILWIHDKDDVQTPVVDALRVKDERPTNVRFEITSGLGHRRIYRDKYVMEQITSFF